NANSGLFNRQIGSDVRLSGLFGSPCVRSTDRTRIATHCPRPGPQIARFPASGLRTGRGSQLKGLYILGGNRRLLRPVYGPDEDRNTRSTPPPPEARPSCVRSTDRTRIATVSCVCGPATVRPALRPVYGPD